MSRPIGSPRDIRPGHPALRAIGKAVLRLLGWRISGGLPGAPRLVVIVAPHTSNWDFIIGLATRFALDLEVTWLGKHTLFIGPWAPLLRRLGGIPVNRGAPRGLLGELVERLNERERFVIALAPEGTRSRVPHWKSGFHAIARQTGALIVPVALDYASKEVRFGGPLEPAADFTEEIARLKDFYAEVTPRHPERFERM